MLDSTLDIVSLYKEFIKTCMTPKCDNVAVIKEKYDRYYCAECALKKQKEER